MGADPNMKATTGELSPLYCCINQLATARLSPEELKEKMNIFPSTLEEQDVFHRYGNDLFGNLVNNQNFLLIQNGFTELLQNRMAEAYVLEKIYRIAELLLNHGTLIKNIITVI